MLILCLLCPRYGLDLIGRNQMAGFVEYLVVSHWFRRERDKHAQLTSEWDGAGNWETADGSRTPGIRSFDTTPSLLGEIVH